MSKIKVKEKAAAEAAIDPKQEQSALSDFVKRNLPSEEEAEKFDQYAREEIREQEIEEGLEEIYQSDGGDKVSVRKIDVLHSRGPILKAFFFLVGLSALLALAWTGYYFYLNAKGDSSSVSLSIAADAEIPAGKEFFYTLTYKNLDRVELKNITIQAVYPDNFVFLSSEPQPSQEPNAWRIDSLGIRRSGEIKIKGRLIDEAGQSAIMLANMTYSPANISSEFKKEASLESRVLGSGLELNVEGVSSLLVNEWTDVSVKYRASEDSYISAFDITLDLPENLELAKTATGSGSSTSALPGNWHISDASGEEKELKIRLRFKDKLNDREDLIFNFSEGEEGIRDNLIFFKKVLTFEVMKRDLNLNLIVNGARTDQGVDFGQTLNYSIVYNNKGKTEMKDVVVMAIIESDFVDWATLADPSKGKRGANTVSWSKAEIPALENLAPESEGTIDFSIKVKPAGEIDPSKTYQVKSYAQFSVGSLATTTDEGKEDTRSNTIINKINSDLSLDEQVRYYNDDNLAVGSGPFPPKVGETTSYKIYWTLTNNLNELSDLRIETVLPAGVGWDEKNRTALGNLSYDAGSNKVVWDIGRLPITAYRSEAEFNLKITPAAADKNKIMVLLSGTTIRATDNVTKSPILKTNKAKTTKLEDDPVVSGDGRVVE